MSDVVLIPLAPLGTLKLPRELFEKYLERPGAATVPAAQPEPAQLLDAAELETRTGVPASWWMTQARERRVPFQKFGRYVRFDLAEVRACDAYKRRVIDSTGHRVQNGGASG